MGEPPSLEGGAKETSRESEPTTSRVAYAGGSGTVTKAFTVVTLYAIRL